MKLLEIKSTQMSGWLHNDHGQEYRADDGLSFEAVHIYFLGAQHKNFHSDKSRFVELFSMQ